MKVLLHGKNAKNIKNLVESFGFAVVEKDPDVIISYGGDGTLLTAERTYPGIPKLPIRDSLVCKKCPEHDEKVLLESLRDNKLKLKEYRKIETTIFYQTFTALNDFVIRNVQPIHAIRFSVSLTPGVTRIQPPGLDLLIGDGVVLSTPFGSTGYFKSITGQTFEETLPVGPLRRSFSEASRQGWAVAFNNTTEKISPLFLKDEETVIFKLVRGASTLSFDNNPDIFKIDEGSEITFKLSEKTAKIYEAESLRCPNCEVTRG